MQPVTASPQQDPSDNSQDSSQDQQSTGFFSGSWGFRDIIMFAGQALTGVGAAGTFSLGGVNTGPTVPPPVNGSGVSTANSYVAYGLGVLFSVATLLQARAHYHWRQDRQKAKNINFTSLANELEKDLKGFQELQAVVEKIEAVKQKKTGAPNQAAVGTQIPPGGEPKRLPDHKTLSQVDDLSDTSVKITV